MSVSLAKGSRSSLVDLHKQAGGSGVLTEVLLGLGWSERTTSGDAYDLDASAFAVDDTGKVPGEKWFIFYGNTDSPDNSIHHHGDNLTGAGDGDDEQITVHLDQLPASIDRIAFAVTIYEAEERKQNFGAVSNAFIRLVDSSTGTELGRFDLEESASLETAVVFGELYRKDGEWKFNAKGQGYNNGLEGLCADHGVGVA